MHGESAESATSRRRTKRRRGRGGEADLHFKPPGEDLCGQIRLLPPTPLTPPPRPCPSPALFLMLSFCLPLTDLLRGADQKRVPSSHLIPRFFSSSSSTDSLPSLLLPPPLSVFSAVPSRGPRIRSRAPRKEKKKGGVGGWGGVRMEMRRWRQKQRQAEKMNICDSPRGLLLKIFCHSDTLAQTCHFLSFSAH